MNTEFQDVSRELLIEIDSTGTIIGTSSNCYNILGYKKTEMIGLKLSNYIVGDSGKIYTKGLSNFELSLKNKQGKENLFDVVIHHNNSDGAKISLINVSKYKKIEEREKRFKIMLENTKDIIYFYEIIPKKKFIYINHALEETLGIPVEEAYKDPFFPWKIAYPDDLPKINNKVNAASNFEKPIETRMRDSAGNYIWFEDYIIPFYNKKGELVAISGFNRNVTYRNKIEKKLEELSYHDSLTGLFSSNYYHKQEKRLNEKKDSSIGIIMCDLDNLKKTNDSLGHTYGDKLLVSFSNLLKREFDNDTVIARFGGDEFVILFENTSEDNVKKRYFQLLQSIKDLNKYNHELPMKASIGWAYSPVSFGAMGKVFKVADDMMYEHKLNKRKKQV